MKIKRIYNNNVILAEDYDQNEMVLFGKGLGFGFNRGDTVNEDLIEKKFEFKEETNSKFKNLIESIPEDIIRLSDELINLIQSELNKEIGEGIYITLTDHISNLVERVRMGIRFDGGLLWNIKQLYPKEHKIGSKCVEIISSRLDIKLDSSEANFIALHIINAETNLEMPEVYQITGLLDKMIEIIDENFEGIDKKSYPFERFMIHCRLFSRNLLRGDKNEKSTDDDENVFEVLVQRYPLQAKTLEKIENMLSNDFSYVVRSDESLYLFLHLIKLTA